MYVVYNRNDKTIKEFKLEYVYYNFYRFKNKDR